MKYIRTKDGRVIDIHKYWSTKAFEIEPDENYWVNELLVRERINKEDCKVFDTIDELCDEAVFFDENNKPHYKSQEGNIWYLGASLFTETLRFGIFTDKGLIYVAKLNEEGEPELL